MNMTELKENKRLLPGITLILTLLIAVLGAKPAWYAVTDLTFYWTDHTETEIKVKTFAEENGLHFAQ